jgi:Winged helix-turn helix/Putative restriction endonuclease
MREYTDNGVWLGWLIDSKSQRVEIYRSGQEVEVLESPVILSGEDVLPGFRLDLSPQSRQQPPLPRWTLKRLVAWVKAQFARDCCRDTLRKILKKLGFSWKKARKLLNKASLSKRAAFLETLQKY